MVALRTNLPKERAEVPKQPRGTGLELPDPKWLRTQRCVRAQLRDTRCSPASSHIRADHRHGRLGLQLCERHRHVQRGAVLPVVFARHDHRLQGSYWRRRKSEHETLLSWLRLRFGKPGQLDTARVAQDLQP